MAGGTSPGRPPQPTHVVTIHHPAADRRGAAAVHRQRRSRSRSSSWCPGSAGATSETSPPRYVGRTASAEQVHATAEQLGFTDPLSVQYGRFVKGIVRRRGLQLRPGDRALPGAVLRLLVHQPGAGLAGPARPAAGDALPRRSARPSSGWSAAWRPACSPRCDGAASSTGRRWASRWPASRCRSSSPACCSLAIFSYKLGITAPGGSYTPFQVNPARVGVRPDPARGSRWPSCTPPGTPGSPGRACWRR